MKAFLLFVNLFKAVRAYDYKILNFLLFFFSAVFHIAAQSPSPIKQWDKTLGTPVDDYLHAMITTPDGGYLLGGYYLQGGGEGGGPEPIQGSYDYYVIKIDKDGNKQWDKTYGGNGYDFLYSIVNTPDSGYLLGGYSLSGMSGTKSEEGKGGYDYWIVKIDKNGNKEWDKAYGGGDYDLLYSLVATSDGGFLLAGNSSSNIGGDKTEDSRGSGDYWVVKIDNNGNKQWDKTLGGSDFDNFKSMINTSDGGFLLGGYTQSGISGDKSDTARGFYDYWIVKIDKNGNKIWDKTFGGNNLDELTSIIGTTDNGYLLGGDSYSRATGDKTDSLRGFNDYWIVKIDSDGNKLWDKTFGGTGSDYFSSIGATNDSNYYLGGSSSSISSGDKSEDVRGETDYWIIKIDSLGNKLSDIVYGGKKTETLSAIVTTEDGYLLGGQSNSDIGEDKSEPSLGRSDFWLVKLGSESIKHTQAIVFDSIADHTYGDTAFALTAIASSGLPVTFNIISGPATIVDSTVNITGAGIVIIEALQQGDSVYDAAPSVNTTFQVYKASPVINWNPVDLIKDAPLGDAQLNATATFRNGIIEGSFIYNPPAGTVLSLGTQTLTTDFTPADTADFSSALNVTASITVLAPPIVNIATPADNSTYLAPANIYLTAAASDSDGTINKVEFYVGETLLYTDTLAPFDFALKNVSSGEYAITAKAIDNSGLITVSEAIHISVVPNKPPMVSIIQPVVSQTVAAPGYLHLEADAEDVDGRIARVEFYNGSTLIRTEYFPPYTYHWENVPKGTYTITAVAIDNWAARTTSVPVTIKVVSPPATIANKPSSESGITDLNGAISLNLAPNPANNIITISTTGFQPYKQLMMQIISSSGAVMKTIHSTNSTKTIQLDVSQLVRGVYTIKMIHGDKVLSRQFVKL